VPKLKNALSAGSSLVAEEIGEIFGLNVADAGFWKGLNVFERFIADLEKIV
jgi:oligoendopeptidase F